MTIKDYDNKVSEIESIIKEEELKAYQEVLDYCKTSNKNEREKTKIHNESPCSVCGKSEFVLKYRDVNGKIEGKVSGSFSLFGGSISGYVDGSISTAPVLSCRNCENERKIEIPSFETDYLVIEGNMPTIFDSDYSGRCCSDWLSEKGLEVARLLAKRMFLARDYHCVNDFSDYTLGRYGLKKKYQLPNKPMFYSIRKFFTKITNIR